MVNNDVNSHSIVRLKRVFGRYIGVLNTRRPEIILFIGLIIYPPVLSLLSHGRVVNYIGMGEKGGIARFVA